MKYKIRILGISGSLRLNSSASTVLQIVSSLFPDHVDFSIYKGIEHIPAFNDSEAPPPAVTSFIQSIEEADAIFFCIPEYAFGVPGALKNALDWTVSSTAFSDKPTALITAASSGDKAHAALLLTLTALGANIPDSTRLLLPFIRTRLTERGEIKDADTLLKIKEQCRSLMDIIPTGNP
jgi:NAD(P)H-dependent FMN reductase